MLGVWVLSTRRVEPRRCWKSLEYWVTCTGMVHDQCSHPEHNETVLLGFRPRRSLMFCSWGAEEYGLIGSIEYVQV